MSPSKSTNDHVYLNCVVISWGPFWVKVTFAAYVLPTSGLDDVSSAVFIATAPLLMVASWIVIVNVLPSGLIVSSCTTGVWPPVPESKPSLGIFVPVWVTSREPAAAFLNTLP